MRLRGPIVGNICSLAIPYLLVPLSLAGSCRRYQTALRLQGRSLVPHSLPIPAQRTVWSFRLRATREGGRPSVERECSQ